MPSAVRIDREQLLTVREVAEMLQLNVRTVSRMCARGQLPNVWIPGATEKGRGIYRIPMSGIAEMLDRNK